MLVPQEDLERLISSRRTSKPSWFNDQEPDHAAVRNAIDVARKAPNHHRTEPARFYLLDKSRIQEISRLFGEIVAGDSPDEFLSERAAKKNQGVGFFAGIDRSHLFYRPLIRTRCQ